MYIIRQILFAYFAEILIDSITDWQCDVGWLTIGSKHLCYAIGEFISYGYMCNRVSAWHFTFDTFEEMDTIIDAFPGFTGMFQQLYS